MEQIAAALILACVASPLYSKERNQCLEKIHVCIMDKEVKDSKSMINKCLPLVYKGK